MATATQRTTSQHLAGFHAAVEQGQLTLALEALREFCLSSEGAPSREESRLIADALQQAGWVEDALPVVEALLEQEDVQPGAGALWAMLKITVGDWEAFKRLRPLASRDALGEIAALEWIDALVRTGNRRQLLRLATVSEFWFLHIPRVWSAMAAALLELGLYRCAHSWVAQRGECTVQDCETLLLIAEILRDNSRVAEGAAINEAAIQEFPSDPHRGRQELWLASDAVMAEDFEAAEQRLRGIDPGRLPARDRLLYTLVAASIGVAQADAARSPEVVSDARRVVDEACRGERRLRSDPARAALCRKVISQLSAAGGLGTRLWGWWRARGL